MNYIEINEMDYMHTVQYYETDKMGITHHSNYIRWMEEARIGFLSQIGWDYLRIETVRLYVLESLPMLFIIKKVVP